MTYDVHFSGTPQEMDVQALESMMDYLGGEDTYKWGYLTGAAVMCKTAEDVQALNMTMGFMGVVWRPFHAFCRKHCLEAYKLWLADDPTPLECTDDGFPIYPKGEEE